MFVRTSHTCFNFTVNFANFYVYSSKILLWTFQTFSADRGAAPAEGRWAPAEGRSEKKDPRSGSFFSGSHFAIGDASSRSGLTDFYPHSNIYLSPIHYTTSSEAAQGASIARTESSGAQAESIARVFFGRKVSLAKCSSERLWNFTLNFSTFYVNSSKILLWTFQTFTFTVPMSHTGHFELWNF